MNFKGKAARIDDYDIPRLGAQIGVGEDELHAFMDVEASGSGFDTSGRPKMLFEPHLFYKELGPGPERDAAVKQGLAYPKWGEKPYPKESYTRLEKAMKINSEAALRSCSWGLTQILGKWHKDIGYATAAKMVEAFMDDEANHLDATIQLFVKWGIDDDLNAIAKRDKDTTGDDWRNIAKVWNGEGYAKHGYHTKLAKQHNIWRDIKDTVWPPEDYIAPSPPPPPPVLESIYEDEEEEVPAGQSPNTSRGWLGPSVGIAVFIIIGAVLYLVRN